MFNPFGALRHSERRARDPRANRIRRLPFTPDGLSRIVAAGRLVCLRTNGSSGEQTGGEYATPGRRLQRRYDRVAPWLTERQTPRTIGVSDTTESEACHWRATLTCGR